MPTALILTLRPQAPSILPGHLGRAAHAAFLANVQAHNPALAQRLHDLEGVKPFATSDLLGVPGGREGRNVRPERTYELRWTSLDPAIDLHLHTLVDTPPAQIELDNNVFTVERATIDAASHPGAGAARWEDLLALEQMGRAEPLQRFRVRFLAPTTFRSNGRSIPLPLPELVFGSLLERWNAAAPIALPVEVRRFASECLVMGRYQLESTWFPIFGANGQGGETAFTGHCTFTATNHDRYYLHCCAALLRLAFYSGIGAKTGMGFGMARWEQRSDGGSSEETTRKG